MNFAKKVAIEDGDDLPYVGVLTLGIQEWAAELNRNLEPGWLNLRRASVANQTSSHMYPDLWPVSTAL